MIGSHKATWGIILSGGNGLRLRHFIGELYGCDRPKQYCAIVGRRSMLRHTIDRAELVISPERLVTIIDKLHVQYIETELPDRPAGNVIVQPCNRDTGPGILHSLFHIYGRNRNATVVIFPADHFVREETAFMEYVKTAIAMIGVCPDIPILIGAKPCHDEMEYGWIEPGERIAEYRKMNLYSVRSFWEKPDNEIVRSLHQGGCLWNTMVIVAKVTTLMDMFRVQTPGLYLQFVRVRQSLGSLYGARIMEEAYAVLPSVNFSRTILESNAKEFGVLPVDGVYWSDWGEEHRIRDDVDRFHLRLNRCNAPVVEETRTSTPINIPL